MENNATSPQSSEKSILAFVGMPGSGKSQAASYLHDKGYPFIRFGQVTIDSLHEQGLPITPENERQFRERLREELGMAAYAIKAESKIRELLEQHHTIVIDGLYSWEEYVYLEKLFPKIIVIFVFTERAIRYERLASRSERPLTAQEAHDRDFAEIERLNKSGPIAIADYLVENNTDTASLEAAIDTLLGRLQITNE
jgi:dephospho-CoA kinase